MSNAKRKAILGLACAAMACSSPAAPEGDPLMVGDIVNTGHGLWGEDADGSFQIHVKADPTEECGVIFSVDDDTWIADARGGVTRIASEDVLTSGATVQLWFRIMRDSCPGQSHADAVKRIN